MSKATKVKTTSLRPPIVAILGHVDHGKTTLLDYIRKSHVAQKEHGGITQHIGAYQVSIPEERSVEKARDDKAVERLVTFIDTPGHEAFAKMRSRGVAACDIAVLVVAANDGVMPQTKEAITHIKKAGVPMVVAVNKTDLPDADIDKVKQQLAREEVLVEGFGGDVVVVPLSAKTGQGIDDLLEVLVLLGQMKDLHGDPLGLLNGVVIETKHDKYRGILATVIVSSGTLKIGDTVYADVARAKVRAMSDSEGRQVKEALPSFPVEIMGWDGVPQVGAPVTRIRGVSAEVSQSSATPYSLSLPPLNEEKKLKLILKTDVLGTLEAIKESLGDDVEWIATGSGEIGEADVLLAKSTGAFLVGFNTQPSGRARKLAETEKVRLKTYSIVYDLLDEVKEVISILKEPQAQEQVIGAGVVLAQFDIKSERIAGCKVNTGKISRNDTVKLQRGEELVAHTRIKSLRIGKENVGEVQEGSECGMVFDKKLDFKVGDSIIAYKKHQLLV